MSKTLCGKNIKRPRQKVIRILKEIMGEEYLIENAEKLGFHVEKAVRKKSDEDLNGKIVSEKYR
ncbi:MAG: hypothetical protein OIN86_04715 [Candidatus Methanoperedens sp.]|nr:hypothetical protein [Candidatus Methanoperedens sp.]CAG0996922.1 hypothetical protein METP1_02627 [Methanosarcinales archaeon]